MTDKSSEGNLDYGRAVRSLREERGMTLEGLAEAAGVSASYLSEVERGLKRPSTDVVAKVAQAFGMPPSVFLEYVESISGRDTAVYMRARFEPPQSPKPQEPRSPNYKLLMTHARQLDESDLKTLVELARRLLRKGK